MAGDVVSITHNILTFKIASSKNLGPSPLSFEVANLVWEKVRNPVFRAGGPGRNPLLPLLGSLGITGWTEYGDETTDGFVYFTQADAEAAANNVTFGSPDKGVSAPGNVKTLESFILDGSALG